MKTKSRKIETLVIVLEASVLESTPLIECECIWTFDSIWNRYVRAQRSIRHFLLLYIEFKLSWYNRYNIYYSLLTESIENSNSENWTKKSMWNWQTFPFHRRHRRYAVAIDSSIYMKTQRTISEWTSEQTERKNQAKTCQNVKFWDETKSNRNENEKLPHKN